MKSFLIIGLGDFGRHLCRRLVHLKNDVLVIDKNEAALESIKDIVNSRLIADCTQRSVLEKIGVSNFDICFVCTDSDFKTNLIIVDLLKELGAKYVVSQTENEDLARFLLKNGADEIIYLNRDFALQAAVKYSSERIFDYINLTSEYDIYEISAPKAWVGKSILESRIREMYDTFIIGIKNADGNSTIMPSPKSVISETDHLLVITHHNTISKLVK